jgi:hypothetical protein
MKISTFATVAFFAVASCMIHSQESNLCLDGFCIGQSIADKRFYGVDWKAPTKDISKEACTGVGCQPENAFRGYPAADQADLAEAVSWKYGMMGYTVITKNNLATLRKYKYECNPSARGMWGERRFFGAYLTLPSQYLTVIGLRLIGDELKVYRIAREFPYHNQDELVTLARELRSKYGDSVLFFDGISSNAPYEVIQQRKTAWFARSTLFNQTDLADNRAEFVIIDPATRPLLEPTSMPDSGEIKPLPAKLPAACSRSLPLQ